MLGTLGDADPPLQLNSLLHPTLVARTQYWIAVQGDAGNSDAIAWYLNTAADNSPEATSSNRGATWFAPSAETPGAYQVNVTVPEPGSLVLITVAGLWLALLRRRRVRPPAGVFALRTLAGIVGVVCGTALCSGAALWSPLVNLAPGGAGVMIQLTDGTVMIQNGASQNWMRLTPDSNGSYIQGTWTANPIAPMKLSRLYFTAQVLQSGKVWVLGGEYSGPFLDANITPLAEIWDPVANVWSPAAPYPAEAGSLHCGSRTVTSNVFETSSSVLSGIYSTAHLQVGWAVNGSGIPAGTLITSIDSDTQVHISQPATLSAVSRLTFTGQALACFGDDPTMLLPNGDILAGNTFNNSVAVYSVATDSWSFAGSKYYTDSSDEEGWLKLSSDKILTYDVFRTIGTGNGYAELFDPVSQVWSGVSPADNTASGSLPVLSSSRLGYELGPALRLLDGRAFQIGANEHTALYSEATNSWVAGPDILGTLTNSQGQTQAPFGADDAPAALLPSGHVLLAADAGPAALATSGDVVLGSNIIANLPSTAGVQVNWNVTGMLGGLPVISGAVTSVDSATQVHVSRAATATATGLKVTIGGSFSAPTQIFDFDPNANTISPLSPPIPDASLSFRPSFVTRMLVLPTGQLLFSDSSSRLYVYTSDDPIDPAVRPVVTGVAYQGAGRFALTGLQLNGQSAGASYGDDVQNDENYPIVRLSNAGGNVFYCRTTDWSSTGVGAGTGPETVNFQLHPSVVPGNYALVVSGAGISSQPAFIHITESEINGQ